jgi:hypothetical protein
MAATEMYWKTIIILIINLLCPWLISVIIYKCNKTRTMFGLLSTIIIVMVATTLPDYIWTRPG